MKITDTPALKQWLLDHQALDLELRSHYHTLHQCPEVGSDLPLTKTYVCDTLRSFGCNPIETPEGGVVILLGSQDPDAPTLLLRADMDALPLKEETDLSFKSTNGSMHACGHDMHTSMMLGVTRLLKEEESTLNGRVKIIFQPHEEGLVGSKRMKMGSWKIPMWTQQSLSTWKPAWKTAASSGTGKQKPPPLLRFLK